MLNAEYRSVKRREIGFREKYLLGIPIEPLEIDDYSIDVNTFQFF